jgi:Uma2 family endonuclease
MTTSVASPKTPRRKRRMSEEEFMRLPDDGRKYELVSGKVKEVPASHKHDVIGVNLAIKFAPYVKGRGYLAGSQAGFRMLTGNIRCPDIAFTLKSRLPDGPSEGFEAFAPDLAIEIVSPSENMTDLWNKVGEYFASGAQQVWLLFPEQVRVNLYTSPFDVQILYGEDEITGGDLLPGFACQVKELFELG